MALAWGTKSMALQKPGAYRLLVQLSGRIGMFVLLASPAVLAQQQKSLPPAKAAAPPAQVDSRADLNHRNAQPAIASPVKQGGPVIRSRGFFATEVFHVLALVF